MNIQQIKNRIVGEDITVQFSFLSDMLSYPAQTLTGASITWTSQTLSLATFAPGSAAITTSDNAIAAGKTNDACLGRFELLAAGEVTVYCEVDAINPVSHYIGVIQIQIEAIPTP